MKLSDFLREKLLFIGIVSFSACFTAFLLYFSRTGAYLAIFIPCLFIAATLISIIPEYYIKKRYYEELLSILEQMDKRHLLAEVVEQPGFLDGRIWAYVLKAAGKSMNDEVAGYRNAFTEYREYIELWVHEIKTPIAGAKLIGENRNNRAALEALDRIESYVDQALYYARSNAVEKDYAINPALLSDLVGGALKSMSRFLISHDISIRTENLDIEVFTDAQWVSFILRQLAGNAVKYGGTVLEFYGEQHMNSVSLFIRDNGIGIPEKDIGRIFQKGFTGVNGRKYGSSTGFGLYLCKKLCGKLGLGISASSPPGRGTTFELSFPKSGL
ncbi:MAG: sensor histidine kinase [Clostridiales Family XIII bacterium]|jgi:signal transduction histidine kinase|nr:sensor histidine kinase [Clostridiales Family XIII bacterium]